MTAAAIRQRLHEYIDSSDDKSLKELLHYIESTNTGNYSCLPGELAELHQRAEDVINGKAVLYNVDDAHNYIRKSKRAS